MLCSTLLHFPRSGGALVSASPEQYVLKAIFVSFKHLTVSNPFSVGLACLLYSFCIFASYKWCVFACGDFFTRCAWVVLGQDRVGTCSCYTAVIRSPLTRLWEEAEWDDGEVDITVRRGTSHTQWKFIGADAVSERGV